MEANKAATGGSGTGDSGTTISGTRSSGTRGSGTRGSGTRGSGTRGQMFQAVAPIAALAGVALLIFVQFVSTPRGGEHTGAAVAPTAAVVQATVAALPAEQGEALAPPAPTAAATVVPATTMDVGGLPTLEAVNCAAPANQGEREACAARLAPAPVQGAPAGVGQGQGGGNRAAAPVVAPAAPPADLVPLSEPTARMTEIGEKGSRPASPNLINRKQP